jgi:hypothetical protein
MLGRTWTQQGSGRLHLPKANAQKQHVLVGLEVLKLMEDLRFLPFAAEFHPPEPLRSVKLRTCFVVWYYVGA